MAFILATIDNELRTKVRMKLTGGGPSGGFGIPQAVRSAIGGRGGNVEFQFPPIIKSDNKGAKYLEKDMANIEPLAVFMGSKARTITLEWTYIVTGDSWSAEKIAAQVKRVRGYFYATAVGANSPGYGTLIIDFGAYNIVGDGKGTWTFRGDGVNVKHSNTIINDSGTYYSLRTDLSMKLKLWSTGETKDGKRMTGYPALKRVKALTPPWL